MVIQLNRSQRETAISALTVLSQLEIVRTGEVGEFIERINKRSTR